MVLEAEGLTKPSANWRPRKADGVIEFKSKGLRTKPVL